VQAAAVQAAAVQAAAVDDSFSLYGSRDRNRNYAANKKKLAHKKVDDWFGWLWLLGACCCCCNRVPAPN
jgi:hypothetical protein